MTETKYDVKNYTDRGRPRWITLSQIIRKPNAKLEFLAKNKMNLILYNAFETVPSWTVLQSSLDVRPTT